MVSHSLTIIQRMIPSSLLRIFDIEFYSVLPRVLRLNAYSLRTFGDVPIENLGILDDWIKDVAINPIKTYSTPRRLMSASQLAHNAQNICKIISTDTTENNSLFEIYPKS